MNARKDAVEILKNDHREARALFETFDSLCRRGAPEADKSATAAAICLALSIHAQVEEEIFYPALRAAHGESDMVDEAEVEHSSAKDLIARISAMRPTDPLHDASVAVLGQTAEHHFKAEENVMFPKSRRTRMDLMAVGDLISARKANLLAEYRALPGDRLRYDPSGDPVGRHTLVRASRGEPMRARVAA